MAIINNKEGVPVSLSLETTYQSLSDTQKNKTSYTDFYKQVQGRQGKGANEDVAIAGVMENLQKTVPPPTILKTDDAENFVTKTQDEIDALNKNKEKLKKEDQPPKIETPKADSPELQSIYDTLDAEYNEQVALIDQIKTTSETRATQQLDNLKNSFEKRRQEMMIYNQNRQKALEIMGGRSGRQRYAQEIQSGILSAEETTGMERIAQINQEENEAIQAVENALQDNEFVIAKQKMDLAKQKRIDKQAELDKLAQLAVAQEKLMIEKQKQAREDSKFLLDYEKFNEEIKKNNWEQAKDIASQSGRQLTIDENGNIEMLNSLTFDNQIKQNEFLINLDRFKLEGQKFGLDVEKYATQKAIDQANLELRQNGYYLNVSKFQQDVNEFDLDYALKQANLGLGQQKQALDRFKAGIPSSYDELGVQVPFSDIQTEVVNVVKGIDESVLGQGTIREDGGFECGEYTSRLLDLGTPGNKMGNLLSEKIETVKKYGLTKEEVLASGGYAPLDVVITDASDVSASGEPLQWGHAAIVIGSDSAGNLILQEANKDNTGRITSGRTISPNSNAIIGILGRKNDKSVGPVGLKEQYFNKAIDKAGQNVVKKLDEINISNLKNSGLITEKQGQAFIGAINSLAVSLPGKQGEIAQKELSRLLNSGDVESAKDFIQSATIAAAPTEQKNKAFGRKEAVRALNEIQMLLNDFERKGGDTGIFTGTLEKIENVIGKTTDPEIAAIATRIRMAIIDYRKSVSGAAFTESEQKEYESVFPSIGKVKNFNVANINTIKSVFDRNQEIFMENFIGAGNYEKLFGEDIIELDNFLDDNYTNNWIE